MLDPMSKINFTNAEKAFVRTVRRLQLWRLLDATGMSPENFPGRKSSEKDAKIKFKNQVLKALKKRLDEIEAKDPNVYQTVGLEKKKLIDLIAHTDLMTDLNWSLVQGVKDALILFKTQHLEDGGEMSVEESIIFQEIEAHMDKRFKVRKGWKPI